MLLTVAVQIDDVDAAEDPQQLLPHQAKRRIVEIAVVGDEADNATARLFHVPLGQADELDVVVVQPCLPLAELLAVGANIAPDFNVAADQTRDPVAGVRREAGEGRVAEEDRNIFGFWILDFGLRDCRKSVAGDDSDLA